MCVDNQIPAIESNHPHSRCWIGVGWIDFSGLCDSQRDHIFNDMDCSRVGIFRRDGVDSGDVP